MQIGDTIYLYEIKLDFMKNQATKENEKHNVLGINEKLLVLNDDTFTCLDLKKKKYSVHLALNEVSPYHHKAGNFWDEIITSLYTKESNSKKAYGKIKKETEKFITEKFGKYCSGIDILNSLEI